MEIDDSGSLFSISQAIIILHNFDKNQYFIELIGSTNIRFPHVYMAVRIKIIQLFEHNLHHSHKITINNR